MAIAAIRYNNPGNVSLPIQGWKGGGTIVGIKGQSGYASFPDMATGYAAFQHRVTNYIDAKGLNTLAKLNTRYAEDPNWAAGISKATGIGINDPLNTSNSSLMSRLTGGILKQETGMSPSSLGINPAATGPNVDGGYSSQYPGIDFNAVPTGTNGEFTDSQLKSMDLNGDGETSIGEIKDYRAIQAGATEKGKNPWSASSTVKEQAAPMSQSLVAATDAQTKQQAISAAQQANAAVQAAAQIAGTEAATTKAALESAGGWLGQTQGWAGNWLVRVMIVLVGLIFIGGALGLLIWKGGEALPDIVTK